MGPISHEGYVSWNTYKHNYTDYDKWYRGATSNPITWDASDKTDASLHLGVRMPMEKYAKALSIERIDGMIWSTVPKIPKRFFLSL